MIRTATMNDARHIMPLWAGDPSSVQHIGDRGNSVFSFRNSTGHLQILRFTDPDFRSFDELAAELNFVNHLYASGVSVARSLPAVDGRLAILVNCEGGPLTCSSVAFAQGTEVQEGSPHWNEDLFGEWGRNLAHIHQAAVNYKPSSDEPKRWQWDNEILIARAEDLIPKEDSRSLEEFREVIQRCQELRKSSNEFGLIHADHAPQNFRYEAERKCITAFDFGNCCYHWFVSDLAISLSTVRRKPNRDQIRASILEGYSSVRSLPKNYGDLIDLFIRLRVVYVYLSRLHLWSENRTPEQVKDLEIFQGRVHEKTGWG